MATNFPNSIDNGTSLPYPSATDDTNSPSLSGGQDNQNDAIIAVETLIGNNVTQTTPTATSNVLQATSGTSSEWGLLTSANVSSLTGTGEFVFSTSPTIDSPTLVSPSISNPSITGSLGNISTGTITASAGITASGLITANGGVTGTTITASALITANDGLTVSSGAVNVPSGTFNKLFNTQSATVTSANASTLVSWNAWGGTYSVACVTGRKYNIRVVEPSVSFDNTVSNTGSNYNVNLLINGGVYAYQQSPLFVVANDGYGVNIFDFWWSATSTATVDFSFQFSSSGASGTYTWSRSSSALAYLIINEFA